MTESKPNHLHPWNFWCRLFGHKLESTGKWRKCCPNVGLYQCTRCKGVAILFPPYKYINEKQQLFTEEYYQNETYLAPGETGYEEEELVAVSDVQVVISDIQVSKKDIEEGD